MNKPIIRLFGRTESGGSICVFYENFQPYFYMEANELTKKEIENTPQIIKVEKVELKTPIFYQEKPTEMLKVTLQNPQEVPQVKEKFLLKQAAKEIHEADILFKNRFLIDMNLHGMNWVEAEAEKTFTKSVNGPTFTAKSIKPIEKKENSDIKYFAYDIECIPIETNRAIDSKKDPIVMISISLSHEHRGRKDFVVVAKPAQGKGVLSYDGEKEMLENFIEFIKEYDPDIITGYNINSFDMPYLIDRLKEHGIGPFFGRTLDKPVYTKKFGMYEECVVPGRVVVDPYQIIRKDPWMKFQRYTLNDVSKTLLNEEKLDVAYKDMPKMWNGSKEDLDKFIEYCRKDADLTLKLLLKVGLLDKFFEISKLSGLVLQDCFGGQTQRIDSLLLREFRKRGMVMPSKPTKEKLRKSTKARESEELKGATVLEPKKGLHSDGSTLVLDFASLYPNIMKTYNISPDTLVRGETDKKTHTSPTGATFLDKEEQEGILPYLVRNLLEARKATKKEMYEASGEQKKILNGRQLALKDIANSMYGYTGYIRARIYVIDVANSITGYGRENILKTKKLVEENFPVEIVYGDTDSIFAKTNIQSLAESKKLGEEISRFISERLPGTLQLEFEKMYRTFLILTKKRYAGWKFEYQGEWKNEIETKGIETVRRDWCRLVSNTLKENLDIILKEGDIKKVIENTRVVLEKLKANEIPIEDLTIIKGITKNPDSYDGVLPHIELAKKLSKRNPQEAPKVGDRIGFVIIKGNQMLSMRSEDPEYVKENKIQIDSEYYIQNQLLPPVRRILEAVGVSESELLGSGRQMNMMDIMNGTKRKLKHDIKFVDGELEKKEEPQEEKLGGYEGFICQECNKQHRRIPLQGSCDCGGKLAISYHGSTGSKIVNA